MILRYHKGNNFGDALNPMIFDRFLPNFFDNSDDEVFVGIGSLLGFNLGNNKKYVFSTGYAAGQESTYGKLPKIDEKFQILCVRGPLTAKVLGLDNNLAVTDGAALLRYFNFEPQPKVYAFSFMPHVGSEDFFDWQQLTESIGINYISPKEDIHKVIKAILSSRVLITEAMHGAIVADTLRVPWIPVKAYKTINDFKWQDWCASLDMKYSPEALPSIFSKTMAEKIIGNKLSMLPAVATKGISNVFSYTSQSRAVSKILKQLNTLKGKAPYLSNESIFYNKSEQLLEILMNFKATKHP